MEDKRQGERRADERREHRREEGRRDGRRPRRRRRPLLRVAAMALAIAAGLGLGFRVLVVAPRRSATVLGSSAWERVAPRLAATSLPMLALPGAAPPGPGQPGDPLPALDSAGIAELSELDLELASAARAAPGAAPVARSMAVTRLLLGDERDARLAWEAMLSCSPAPWQAEARVGLGILDLRAGLRAAHEQDRRFAFERALVHFERATSDEVAAPYARFDRAVAFALLGRSEEARALADELPPPLPQALRGWLDGG